MGRIEKRLTQLFEDWRKELSKTLGKKTGDRFVTDGPLDEDRYIDSSPKILFLNKEVWGLIDNGYKSLPQFVRNIREEGYRPRMWENVKNIVSSVDFKTPDAIPAYSKIRDFGDDRFLSIAAMNIKKIDENNRNSGERDLKKHFSGFRQFIYDEIKILNPDIVVCGNVLRYFKDDTKVRYLLDEDWIKPIEGIDSFYACNHMIFVDFWHPAWQGSYRRYYEEFAKRYKKYLVKCSQP